MGSHIGIVALLAVMVSFGGCAGANDQAPSYLGFTAAAEDDEPAPAAKQPSKPGSHVSSNKVLGAMAFQKVTGRAVDPARLEGSQ
jgi:hypothetical protein